MRTPRAALVSLSFALFVGACRREVYPPEPPFSRDVIVVDVDVLDSGVRDVLEPDVPEPPGETVDDAYGSLSAFTDGTFTLRDINGLRILERASADVLLGPRASSELVRPANCTVRREEPAVLPEPARSALGPTSPALVLSCRPDARVAWDLYLQLVFVQAERGLFRALVARMNVRALSEPLRVLRVAPIAVTEGRGAFYVSGLIGNDRVLDNGSALVAESSVRLSPGNRPRDLAANALPVPLRGSILANNNLGIFDLDTGVGFAAGFLSAETGTPHVGLGRGAFTRDVRPDGAEGYETFVTEVAYLPSGKTVTAASSLWSEWAFVTSTPTSEGGHGALTAYANAVRAQQRVVPWQDRAAPSGTAYGREGRHVPAVWRRLANAPGDGRDALDPRDYRASVDYIARELAPYGLTVAPVGEGWEPSFGDGVVAPARFPEGLASEVRYANARGLAGGLWSSPFALDPAGETARANPAWVDAFDPAIGALGVAPGALVLDLSRDDVLARVRANARATSALGLGWSEQDRTQYSLFTSPSRDDVTALEAYRRAWAAVREETRDETFLLAPVGVGSNYGSADGVRTSPSTGGRWDEARSDLDALVSTTRSFKTSVRAASRRWYTNDRVAVLDPGALTFQLRDPSSPVGVREHRTFSVFAAMLGGVIEVEDPLMSLTQYALDTVRRVVPPYGYAARPLDVFTREYNERWVLPVRSWSSDPAAPAPWVVAAVTHWGTNRAASSSPFAAMPDEERSYSFSGSVLQLAPETSYVGWSLFSNELIEINPRNGFMRSVFPHESLVVVVREVRPGAQLLGTDRHITGGAVDVRSERWDAATRTLRVGLRLACAGEGGYTTPLLVALRVDEAVQGVPVVLLDGAPIEGAGATRDGQLVSVRFVPPRAGDAVLSVRFGG